jgi:hypothetical protein
MAPSLLQALEFCTLKVVLQDILIVRMRALLDDDSGTFSRREATDISQSLQSRSLAHINCVEVRVCNKRTELRGNWREDFCPCMRITQHDHTNFPNGQVPQCRDQIYTGAEESVSSVILLHTITKSINLPVQLRRYRCRALFGRRECTWVQCSSHLSDRSPPFWAGLVVLMAYA